MASTAVSKYRTAVKVATAAGSPKTITGITAAASAVVTSAAHGLTVGQVVVFASVSGMTEINGVAGLITAANTGTFTVNINSTGFTAYTSGGTATAQTMTLVENVLDFQRNGDEADRIDSTNLQSTKKEYIVGLAGEGSITMPIDVDYSGPGQASVRSKVGTDTAQAVSVTRADSKTETMMVKWTNFSESFGDKHGGSFSGAVTGPVGWYA
jgi:Ubiquitin-activating enzyme E1 FCCH domain